MSTSKICTKCDKEKSLDDFARDRKGILGRHSQCKACEKKARLDKGEGAHAARQKVWRENNQEHYRTYARLWSYKKLGIKITEKEYKELLKKQGNSCALCGNPPPAARVLCLDHDHKTGKVRGLLCNDCNIALGKFRDNVETLGKAIVYLSKE